MKRGCLQRCWDRQPLTTRLVLCSGLILLGCVVAFLYVILQNAIVEHRTLLHDRLQEEMHSALLALTEPAVMGDYAAIEQILQGRARQAVVAQFTWTDSRGHHIWALGEDTETQAPWWFVELLALPDVAQTQQIVVAGESYGSVFLRLTPTMSINRRWHGFVQTCGGLMVGATLSLGITLMVLHNGLRPLHTLASSARRFGQGDHAVRIPLHGPPETTQCIQAFNGMAENIASLLASLRHIVEAMPIPVLISRLDDDTILYANQHLCTLLSVAEKGLVGHKTSEFYHNPTDHQHIYKSLAEYGYVRNYEIRLKKPNGTLAWAVASIQTTTFKGEQAILTGLYDMTHTRNAEEALQRMHAQTVQLLDAISSLLIGVDTDTRFTWWNYAADTILGTIPAEAIGQPVASYQLPWDSAAIRAGLRTCADTGEPVRVDDVRFQRADGTEGYLGITINPMLSATGDADGFLLLGADITSRKHLEQQLMQAQKLEAIGQLAAGIAHEINTPTQFIGDNLSFLQDAFGDLCTLMKHYTTVMQALYAGAIPAHLLHEVEGIAEALDVGYLIEEIPTAIAQSIEGVERVARLVRAMKDFSHPSSEEKTPIDLNKAIDSTIIVARNEWRYVADLVTDFDPTLPPVPCFPGSFNQVILNIIVNAAHAIADAVQHEPGKKGTITVSTRWESGWAEIRIADTGPGIPAAIHNKVFDPFFTTKGVGQGTGQGLAIAHDVVVKKHAGRLTFETTAGHGTTFLIRLPLDL